MLQVTGLRETRKVGDARRQRLGAGTPVGWVALLLAMAGGTALGAPPGDLRISAERLRQHVTVLASDAFGGRAVGTGGGALTEAYLAGQLTAAGVVAWGQGSGFVQAVPMHGSVPLPESELALISPCHSGALSLGKDYLLFTSGDATRLPQPVEVVFAGYGIVAPELGEDDYAGLDVRGKVVAVLAGEPRRRHRPAAAGDEPTLHAAPETKRRTALSRGAVGLLIVPSLREPTWRDWSARQREFAFEHVVLPYTVTQSFAALLHRAAAEKLFCQSPYSLDELDEMDRAGRVPSFATRAQVRFRGVFAERDFVAHNVMGVVRGSDPALADTFVLLTAHHDHLGEGPAVNGDRIYNGVVDNAMGVAAVLEAMRVLATSPQKPRRSVAAVFFTGEEKGLLGSTYFLDHPPVPLGSVVAAVNVDGLATFDTFNDIVVLGGEWSTLGDTARDVAASLGLKVSALPPALARPDLYALSDQIALAQAGIPTVLVNEGFQVRHHRPEEALAHAVSWGQTRYHTPFDDLTQPIDWAAAAQHAEVVLALVWEVAEREKAPSWLPASPFGRREGCRAAQP